MYFLIGKTLPAKHRRKYIFSIYLKLIKTYNPIKVNSDLLIFRSQENLTLDKHLGWDGLVNNIHLKELEGDHLKILYIENNHELIWSRIYSFIENQNNKPVQEI